MKVDCLEKHRTKVAQEVGFDFVEACLDNAGLKLFKLKFEKCHKSCLTRWF